MMKNGNLKTILIMTGLGYVVGSMSFISRKKIYRLSDINKDNYLNRLKEFYIDDYPRAVKKYNSFVASGMSKEQSFDILVKSLKLNDMLVGEIND
jgi:hypothetical protein